MVLERGKRVLRDVGRAIEGFPVMNLASLSSSSSSSRSNTERSGVFLLSLLHLVEVCGSAR